MGYVWLMIILVISLTLNNDINNEVVRVRKEKNN